MRFSASMDALQKENQFIRLILKALIPIMGVLVGLLLMFFDRAPIVIERSSHGLEIVNVVSSEKSELDLKHAVDLMMHARFDSDAIASELFLNPKELLLRSQEQKDLKSRAMSQVVVVRNVKISKDTATVDLDRVIAVGEVRSALKAQLKILFEAVSPNELNPYGLLLSAAEPVEVKNSGGATEKSN